MNRSESSSPFSEDEDDRLRARFHALFFFKRFINRELVIFNLDIQDSLVGTARNEARKCVSTRFVLSYLRVLLDMIVTMIRCIFGAKRK